MMDNNRIFDAALAIRAMRPVREDMDALRAEVAQSQSAAAEQQLELVQQMIETQNQFTQRMIETQEQLVEKTIELVNVLRQQAATTVPETKSKAPKRVTIKHSDGTASTIEFNGNGRFN